MNKAKGDFKDELTRLSEGKSLSLSVPKRTKNDHNTEYSFLQDIHNRCKNGDRPPVILWNLIPWNNYSLIHAIFVTRLQMFQRLGMDVVIVLHDKVMANMQHLNNASDQKVLLSVNNLRRWFTAAKLNPAKSEIFLESEICQMVEPDVILRWLPAIAHSSDSSQTEVRPMSVSSVLAKLFELLFETVLNVDFVLTGGRDATDIWNLVRLGLLQEHFIQDYKPPCVLSFPSIIHSAMPGDHDLNRPASTQDDDVTVFKDVNEIVNTVLGANDHYIEQIYDLFLIPQASPLSLRIDGVTIDSYETAKQKCDIKQLRKHAAQELADYFVKIKETG